MAEAVSNAVRTVGRVPQLSMEAPFTVSATASGGRAGPLRGGGCRRIGDRSGPDQPLCGLALRAPGIAVVPRPPGHPAPPGLGSEGVEEGLVCPRLKAGVIRRVARDAAGVPPGV